MNKLDKLASLIKSGTTDELILKRAILDYISDDADIIPNLLYILSKERETNKELISGLNLNLTRNTLLIQLNEDKCFNTPEQREFHLKETESFYKRFKKYIKTAGIKLWPE